MESLYFGSSDKQLYGVFHSANPETYQSRAVLMMYPLAQEYMRIHRAYRRLADALSQDGMDVLRFDYAGTGDSYGEFESASLREWQENAITAYEELSAMCPDTRVDVVALRAGTVIARELINRYKVNRLVMWEPKTADALYLSELEDDIRKKGRSRSNFIDERGSLHYNGFCYSSRLREELCRGGWGDLRFSNINQILAISTRDNDDIREIADRSPDNVNTATVDGPSDWTVVDSVGGLFFPEPSIAAIRQWLAR